MASKSMRVNSQSSLDECVKTITELWIEKKYIHVTANDKRSLDQNAAIRMCYKQIFEHRGDITLKDVERQCKLNYGVPILRQHSIVFDYVFKQITKPLNYEQKLKIMDCLQVTSHEDFSTDMAAHMINSMMLDNPYIVLEKNNAHVPES